MICPLGLPRDTRIQGTDVKITIAESAGFCFGVKRAIELAQATAAESDQPVQMLGHIVHNERVVEQVDKAGVKVIESIEAAQAGILMIRAHGTGPRTYSSAEEHGLGVVDATCPLVTEIHGKVKELHEDGYPVMIIGDHGHDEVRGIAAQVPDAIIIASPDEVDTMPKKRYRRLGIVVQSTQNVDNVNAIMTLLVPRCMEIRFFNTICFPTTKHQTEIRTMPLEHDVMVIVGSFTSANTMRMAEISSELNPRSYQVTGADGLEPAWFEGATSVGVHAGASTPDFVIYEVVEGIEGIAEKLGEA